MKTKLGELSVNVSSFQLLSKALRPLPEKWHGLTDTDTRYRQRYVDLIANDDARRVFDIRFAAIARDAPLPRRRAATSRSRRRCCTRSRAARPRSRSRRTTTRSTSTCPCASRPSCTSSGSSSAATTGVRVRARVPQRRLSTRHNPEFTMLELYEAFADYYDMMRLTEELIADAAPQRHRRHRRSSGTARKIDLTPPFAAAHDDRSHHASTRASTCIRRSRSRSCARSATRSRCRGRSRGPGKLVLEIYEKTTEANIVEPTFVCDYPRDVSPLAAYAPRRSHADRTLRAHRPRPRARQRVQRAERSRRPAAALRGAGVAEAARRRRGAGHRRRLRARARVRPAADRRARSRRRPSRHGARGRHVDPRSDPVPAPASGGGDSS